MYWKISNTKLIGIEQAQKFAEKSMCFITIITAILFPFCSINSTSTTCLYICVIRLNFAIYLFKTSTYIVV